MHARSYSEGMEILGTVQDDVSAVRDFASQVRALCAQLTANPFNTPADRIRSVLKYWKAYLAVAAVLVLWGYLEAGPATSDDLYYEQNVVAVQQDDVGRRHGVILSAILRCWSP